MDDRPPVENWPSSPSPSAPKSLRGLLSVVALPFRRLKRTMRSILLITLLVVVVVPLGHYSAWSAGLDMMRTSTTATADDPDSDTRSQELANFEAQFNRTRELAAHPSPLSLQRYCSNPRYKTSNANYLVSAVIDEGTVARMDFGVSQPSEPRYNPNILPFPKGYKYPYIGFARQSPKKKSLYHHEIVWCEMEWADTAAVGRKILRCVDKPTKLDLDEWPSPKGSCPKIPYLALMQGHMDPRVLVSPWGEPLMIVGTNGKSNCLNQFVIDLRAVVPGLNWKMKLQGVPIRFKTLTELPRPEYNEIEKNWFLIWDDANVGYVQHETEARSVSSLLGARSKQVNVATPNIPACVSSLKKKLDGVDRSNDIHQGSNSLRVTLCDFPCIPTIHNTVIVELMHMKYKNYYEIFYRRYAIIMNTTAPFNIIGRTGNLMYAGTDESTMLYTVSITWDHEHYRNHDDWNEDLHGGHWFFDQQSVANDNSPTMPLHKRSPAADKSESAADPTNSASTSAVNALTTLAPTPSASSQPTTAPLQEEHPQNPLVNKYYHGWLDDMIMISIGVNDKDSEVMHVRARDLLECIHVC
ncbi:hypothetical protein V1509DRAFT_643172 [Lipomyces kononenkoae]